MGYFSFIIKLTKQRLIIGLILAGLILLLVPFSSAASLGLVDKKGVFSDTGRLIDVNSPVAKTIYVDQDAIGGANNGTSWANAFLDLQDALAAAVTEDQIWVAEGVYKPTSGTDRNETFQLKNEVAIYGGFTGTENNLNERDWQANPTVLSGNIGLSGDDNDNSFHVVKVITGTIQTALLDGFTISDGMANGVQDSPCDNQCGAGIYVFNGSPTLQNLIITGNTAPNNDGGGMYTAGNGQPFLGSVTFTGNLALRGGGMANVSSSPSLINTTFISNTAGIQGGGLYNVDGSSSILTNVTFEDNKAINNGGGMFNRSSQSLLVDVTFLRNRADNNGGGMYTEFGETQNTYPTLNGATFTGNRAPWGGGISNVESSMVVINAVFSGNFALGGKADLAQQGGGAIHNYSSNPTLTNVTISGNESADNGGGIRNHSNSFPNIQNSIIWDNEAPAGKQIFNEPGSQPTIQYSDVQGQGGGGIGNIDADPKFIQAPDRGTDGEWGTPDDDYGNLRLQAGSPAINTGNIQLDPDPNSSPPDSMYDIPYDIVGNPRIAGGQIEMGAYTFEGKSIVYLPIIFRR